MSKQPNQLGQKSHKDDLMIPDQETFLMACGLLEEGVSILEVAKLFANYRHPEVWLGVVQEMKSEVDGEDEEALSSSKPSSSGSDGWEKYDPEEWDRATKKADVEGYPIRVDSLKSAPRSSKAEPRVPRQAAFEIQGFFAQADEFEGASGSSIAMDRVPLREIIDPHRFSAHADNLEVEASSSKAKSQRTQSDAPRLRRAETPEHSPEAPGTIPEAETPHSPEEPPISYDVDFVRALGDSDKESKVPFSEGDILRIIGHRRRADLHYHVLPLKPPGGHGRALRSCVEAVSQGDVDEVGRLATTDEEKRCFKAAVEWEDD